jgi:serine protease Do/serine protease DegQ
MGGVVVLRVTPGSLAEEAGLSTRQIITQVNGKAVDSARTFKDAVENVPSGEGVVLRVISVGRDGQKNVFFTSLVKP